MSIKDFINFAGSTSSTTECLNKIVSECTDYLKISEQEKTKRREIDKLERESISRIKAQKDILMKYLDRSFDVRSDNFRSLFCIIDQAILSGNNEQLAMALHTMTEMAKSNPFKDLSNLTSVRAALNNAEHEWKF
jgi:hypothetical protein